MSGEVFGAGAAVYVTVQVAGVVAPVLVQTPPANVKPVESDSTSTIEAVVG
jgi:hypothetical protein